MAEAAIIIQIASLALVLIPFSVLETFVLNDFVKISMITLLSLLTLYYDIIIKLYVMSITYF